MAWGRTADQEHEISKFNETVFSGPISGKSILQIGTSPPGFGDEVVKRGASFTVYSSPDHSDQARATAAHGTSVEYIDCDFEEWSANEKSYDIVLCINALHHFYDPVGALRKMMRISRERILLEFATPTFSRRWKDLPFTLVSGMPLILMDGRFGAIENAADRTFLFTISALRKIFNEHTLAFEPLRIVGPSKKGRTTVDVQRRRIGHLVVVAGVACVGKTRFMDALLHSDSLRARFDIAKADLEMINASRVQSLPSRPLPNLVLHYDILRPSGRHLERHSRDPVFHLLHCAEQLTVITLVQTRETIIQRSTTNDAPSKRREHLAKHYDKKDFLNAWHEAWFNAISSVGNPVIKDHIIIADDYYPEIEKDAALAMLR